MSSGLSRRALWMHKLATEVARHLDERIASGAIPEGAKLPDRDALAGEFVTSLGVIDRALEILVSRGQIRELPNGSFVVLGTALPTHGFEIPGAFGAIKQDVIAIMELRMGVELVAAALAAERRDDMQLTAIQNAKEAYKLAVADKTGMPQADLRFHLSIAAASGNTYILDLLEYLGPLLIPRLRMAIPVPGQDASDRNLTASVAEHAAIVEAIEKANVDAARNAMRMHLTRSIAFIQGVGNDGS
ncbi:FadR/GntR family transcriptional regulator [Pseudoruegeria sp. HB172150]|uniref:FadR/GntR family transcriptional regulator n=1 Tax=Pseudoruegeria sp. HB172150 TaxID=2721164 RepID=UPI0015578B56|nr:FCD domain-containing protein [Pseudoruegeria sp. HB172150]